MGIFAEHADGSTVGHEDARDHPKRRRLARAVGADEAVHAPGRHAQAEVIHGHLWAEGLGDVDQFDGE